MNNESGIRIRAERDFISRHMFQAHKLIQMSISEPFVWFDGGHCSAEVKQIELRKEGAKIWREGLGEIMRGD